MGAGTLDTAAALRIRVAIHMGQAKVVTGRDKNKPLSILARIRLEFNVQHF